MFAPYLEINFNWSQTKNIIPRFLWLQSDLALLLVFPVTGEVGKDNRRTQLQWGEFFKTWVLQLKRYNCALSAFLRDYSTGLVCGSRAESLKLVVPDVFNTWEQIAASFFD